MKEINIPFTRRYKITYFLNTCRKIGREELNTIQQVNIQTKLVSFF